jgi:hypothetical protein
MVHGEFEPSFPAGTFTEAQLQAFEQHGITREVNADGTVTLVIPLAVAFGNPDLVQQIGLGPALGSLAERQYKNDEQIDNAMRSVLFQVPKPGTPDARVCGEPVVNPQCFTDIADLGADDVMRGRDHGMPTYNQLRRAYGLQPVTSFTQITGERTDRFPAGTSCNSPSSLTFVSLADDEGNPVPLGDQEEATYGVRRSTLAARLRCVYGDVNAIEAFTGMVSEKHVAGTELGPLQLAIWRQQFSSLRDGDSMFYAIDPALPAIKAAFGITYRHTLGEIVRLNTNQATAANVFLADD